MPEQLTISFDAILAVCGLIIAIGGAAVYIRKASKPLFKPWEDMQDNIDSISARNKVCDKQFANDDKRIKELEKAVRELREDNKSLREDNKFLLESVALLLQNAETGNCTGAIRQGRKDLETYLINRN